MVSVTFSNSNKTFILPESWEELSPQQFLAVIDILAESTEKEKAKWRILQALLNAPDRVFYNFNSYRDWKVSLGIDKNADIRREWLANAYSDELLPIIEFIWEPGPIFKNLVPSFTIGRNIYHGPKDGFEDVSMYEIEEADQYYQMYVSTKEDKYMHNVAACLYRLKDKDRKRTKFVQEEVENTAKSFSVIPKQTLLAIKMTYERILLWYSMNPQYKSLFEGTGGKADLKSWSKLVRGMSGEKLGTIEQVRKLKLYEAFDQLGFANEEAKAIIAQTKK